MKKILKSLLFFSLSIYIAFGFLIYIMQDSMLYHPQPKSKNKYKEKIFYNDSESIHATLINEGKEKAILYFGGNAEDVDSNYKNFSKAFKDYTIYLIQYRGYGNSSGKPSEDGLYSDAIYIFDKINSKYKNITLIGRSLGTGVSTYLASKRDIKKLVLVTPFDSMESIAQNIFKLFPISLMLRDKYDSISRVDHIKVPTLIIYAENDETIKKIHTDNLVRKFEPSQLTIKTIENEDHNSISKNEKYYIYLKEFIN